MGVGCRGLLYRNVPVRNSRRPPETKGEAFIDEVDAPEEELLVPDVFLFVILYRCDAMIAERLTKF